MGRNNTFTLLKYLSLVSNQVDFSLLRKSCLGLYWQEFWSPSGTLLQSTVSLQSIVMLGESSNTFTMLLSFQYSPFIDLVILINCRKSRLTYSIHLSISVKKIEQRKVMEYLRGRISSDRLVNTWQNRTLLSWMWGYIIKAQISIKEAFHFKKINLNIG